MSMRSIQVLLVLGVCAVLQPALASAGDADIKLSGCLIKAEGDSGYLLINAPAEPPLQSNASKVAPSAVGTSGNFTTVFYWLGGNDKLSAHVGHQVEVEGDLKGDIKDGEIKMERKDRWTELTVKTDGRTLKANVPEMSLAPSDRDDSKKRSVMVRRVEVEHIKMKGASCTP